MRGRRIRRKRENVTGKETLFSDEAYDSAQVPSVKVAFSDDVTFKTVRDATSLFDGFSTMKAITWSYGLRMVVRQTRKFEHVELVFGCSEMLDKDVKLSSLAPIVQQAQIIKDLQSKAGREISERVENGSCDLYFEQTVRSHQKLYLLADESANKFRVITGSANLSSAAWLGDKQKEVLVCFEGRACYDAFLRNLYEPFKRTCSTQVKHPQAMLDRVDKNGFVTIDDVPILQSKDGLIIIEESETAPAKISMADCALYGGLDQSDAATLESTLKLNGGKALLDAQGLSALRLEGRRLEEAKPEQLAQCPKLIVRDDGEVLLNGHRLSCKGFERDAQKIAEFINSFDIFSGDIESYKADAWKILCWYFATPFFPKLRRACREARQDGRVSSLPMCLILFGSSNAGKTALMRFLGKAMCGEEIRQLAGTAFKAGRAVKEVKSTTVRKPRLMQINQQGMPVLYDDVPGSELSDTALRKLLIDTLDEVYDRQYPHYPAIVATTNITPAMPREFRKRALFFESSASLSALDAIANGHIPSKLTEEVGCALFVEYARRMAPPVALASLPERISELDVYALSSKVMMDIFEEASVHPSWAKLLSNDDYFGERAESRRATQLLLDYFQANTSSFERSKHENQLVIRYAISDRAAAKLLKEVSASLPPRCEPKLITGMLLLNLRETEDLCGRKLVVGKNAFTRWLLR